MKAMIRTELQSINNQEERIILKDLMEQIFLPVYEANEKMYQKLETWVMDDLAYDVNRYLIRTGLVEREHLDSKDRFMSAMRIDDQNKTKLSIRTVQQQIVKEGQCFLGTVFLQSDYIDISNLLKQQDHLSGTIRGDNEYPVEIKLIQNRSYLCQIEDLYRLFIENGIPWQTINAPYLFKLADAYAVKLSGGYSDQETVKSFEIDQEASGMQIRYNLVPVWNVRQMKMESDGFPVSCGDHKNYEHIIPIAEYDNNNIYLVDGGYEGIKVQQNATQLVITGPIEEAKKWDIYSIRNGSEENHIQYTYPVMENSRIDGFMERFQRKHGQAVKTRMELERFVLGFGLGDYLGYRGCRVEKNNGRCKETYSMNFFIQDEIRESPKDKCLILMFRPNMKEQWLTRDLMSFIVSEVQVLYPEYECAGILE